MFAGVSSGNTTANLEQYFTNYSFFIVDILLVALLFFFIIFHQLADSGLQPKKNATRTTLMENYRVSKMSNLNMNCGLSLVYVLGFKYIPCKRCIPCKSWFLISKKNCFIFFNKNLLKLMKNTYYFILQGLFSR